MHSNYRMSCSDYETIDLLSSAPVIKVIWRLWWFLNRCSENLLQIKCLFLKEWSKCTFCCSSLPMLVNNASKKSINTGLAYLTKVKRTTWLNGCCLILKCHMYTYANINTNAMLYVIDNVVLYRAHIEFRSDSNSGQNVIKTSLYTEHMGKM